MRRWIERQRNVLDLTLSSLVRRRGKNLALLALYTLVVFLLASVTFFARALQREAELVLAEAPDLIVQRTVAGRHDLVPLGHADVVRGIRGVATAHGRLWGYYFDPRSAANYTLLVPASEEPPAGRAVVGSGVARLLGLRAGDALFFRTHENELLTLTVADTFSAASELVSADLVLVGEADFRRLFGIPDGWVTDLALTVRNPAELATIAAKIARQLPGARPITRDEMLRTYEAIFGWRGGVTLILLFSAVVAFVIFAWDRASGLSAEERREIGILKAVGWETSDVLLLRFWEGAVLSLTAFLGGTVLAYMHVFFADSVLFEQALKGWSTLYPRFRLQPFVRGDQVAALFVFTVVPYTLATMVPSWRAATADPDLVMRNVEA